MNDRPPPYTFNSNFESSNPAISTIGGTEAYNRKSGRKSAINHKNQETKQEEPSLCQDGCGIIRSKLVF